MPVIYSVTTNFISGHKMGFWSGTPKKLWARYLTYYGPELTISLFNCDNKTQEAQAHEDLIQYRLKGSRELYREGTFQVCENYLKGKFGTPQLYDKEGMRAQNLFSMADLTTAYILRVLKPVITKSLMQQGIDAITDVVAKTLLQRDGKYIYYCADRSRSRFMMVINHNGEIIEEADPESIRLRSVICGPLLKLAVPVATKHEQDESIMDSLEAIENIEYDPRIICPTLLSILPSGSDGVSESMRTVVDEGMKALKEGKSMLKTFRDSRKVSEHLKLLEKTKTSVEELLDQCEKRSDGLYWHNTRHWIVQLTGGKNYQITGYAPKKADKPVNLTKAQVSAVSEMGLSGCLHPQYTI